MTLSISREKLNNLITECKRLLSNPVTTLRNLSHVIGLMTSVTLAVLPASLHCRFLLFQENKTLANHHSYKSSIQLNQESMEDLLWWCSHLKKWNDCPIHPPTPQMILETDASNTGWGAYYPALNQTRWVMKPGGVETPHQLQGTPSCLDYSPDLCEHAQVCTYSHQDGQHFSSRLYRSHGSSNGDDHRYPPPPTSCHGSPTGSTGESPSINGSGTSPVSCLECIRSTFQGRGLSEDAVVILCASWRTNTETSYSSTWNKWSRWCEQHHIDPLSTSVVNIIEFLTQEFLSGEQYCIIPTDPPFLYLISQWTECKLESTPWLGVYHLRPPQPIFNGMWKVDVLLCVSSLGPTNGLSVKDLTHKLALLLALVNGDRTSDLQTLDVQICHLFSNWSQI